MPLFVNHTTGEAVCQDEIALEDGKRDWKKRKKMSINVSKLMTTYDPERAEKIRNCSTYLEFVRVPDGSKKLHKANFCRERLCPVCQWRRSIKLGIQADQIYRMLTGAGYKHIFITLTVKNCIAEELGNTVNHIIESFGRLKRSKMWEAAIAGSYRALEITYNEEKNTYHPHIHVLASVWGDYFDGKNEDYITTDKLIAGWRKAARLDYNPDIGIEAVKQKPGQTITSACAEMCKYPCKSAEIHAANVLKTIDFALRGRRLIQWAGVAANARRELELDDIETGNLIQIGDELPGEDELEKIVYIWRYGIYIPLDYTIIQQNAQ